MGKRLPPGEAARRAQERHRATFSGARYARYDVEKEGFGSTADWARAASAFIHGDMEGFEYVETPTVDKPTTKRRPLNVDPRLLLLGLEEFPAESKILTAAYRRSVMAAFRECGSSDTDERYVSQFMALTQAYDRLKFQRGW